MEHSKNTSHDRGVVRRAHTQLDESERALHCGLKTVYPAGCEIEMRRWIRETARPTSFHAAQESSLVECPVAAVVTVPLESKVLAVAVFVGDIDEEQLNLARQFCRKRNARFFPVERLFVYHHRLLHHVAESEAIGLDAKFMLGLVPEARCPECGGPLIHRIKLPAGRRNGLFYACAQHLPDSRGMSACKKGFICGVDEIHQYVDSAHRTLMTRLNYEPTAGGAKAEAGDSESDDWSSSWGWDGD